MNWQRAGLASLIVLPLFWLLSLGFGNDPHAVPFVLNDTPAKTFALTTLDGKPFDLAAQRGKPVVLNFWATWCVPCKAEYPVLKAASEALGEHVAFAGLLYQDDEKAAKAFMKTYPLPFPQLLDPDSRVAMDYGVTGVPETFFIDAKGIIKKKHNGVLTYATLREGLDLIVPRGAQP